MKLRKWHKQFNIKLKTYEYNQLILLLTLSLPIFWLPVPGKHIYVREIKLHPLTFVNTAIIIANGTEGILSTLVSNGTGMVSTIVAKGSERVKLSSVQLIREKRCKDLQLLHSRSVPSAPRAQSTD